MTTDMITNLMSDVLLVGRRCVSPQRNRKQIFFLSVCSIFLMYGTVLGQNLVPNPSFESYTACPTGLGQIANVTDWQNVASHTGTPDFYHNCGTGSGATTGGLTGPQAPRTGDAYAGLMLYSQWQANRREYIQAQLISPLVAGVTYCVAMHVSLCDDCNITTTNGMEAYLSNTPVVGGGWFAPITAPAQFTSATLLNDKTNWMELSFLYTATGGEEYITLGNFKNDAATSITNVGGGIRAVVWMFIEDISVEVADANWTVPALLCASGGQVNLSSLVTGTPGGTFTGTGVSGNMFDPAAAGVGTHNVTYTIPGPCGANQMEALTVVNCTLPVELLEFNAEAVDERKVALTWTTVNEINNDYFEIERSQDGVSFNTIGWVDGAGNSNITLHYNDYDENPYNGVSYYRLKQTDFDGTYTYSEIRTVIFDDLSFVNLYPNPAEDELQFTVMVSDDADLHVHIVDVTGRLILEQNHWIESGESTITLDVSNLASGMYTIRVNTNDENHLSKEFIRR